MTPTKQLKSSELENPTGESEKKPQKPNLNQGPGLEADSIFPLPGSPNQPETTYKSSYFQDSYYFPWNPDRLSTNNLYKIYDEMKDDDQVKSAISYKKDIVVNSGWQIVCENEDIKEFVTKALNESLDAYELGKSFDDVIRDMLSSFEYGFSLSEPVYELGTDNLYRYKSINVRPPHSFRFDLDRYGRVQEIIQSTDQAELKFKPTKFLHHVYQQEFGNPYGKSDLKAAHPAWAAKKFFMRMYAIYVERFASPTVVGKYKSQSDPEEIRRYFDMIKTIQQKTALVVPEDMSLEFIQSDRDAGDTYIKGLEMYNLWISRAILVPDLMGISGEKTSGGSYSLGETQFKMFLGTIEKDRKSLAKKITLKLVQPLVQANFGTGYECRFEFMPITDDDELEYSKTWSDFMKSRLVKPTEEEVNHFRRAVKYPEGPVEFQAPKPDPFEDRDPNAEDDDTSPEKGDKDIRKEKKKPEEKEMVKKFRELNPYEVSVNFAEIRKSLDGNEARMVPKLQLAGKSIIADFVDQVRDRGMIKNFQPDKVNDLQPKFLRDMNVIVKNSFVDLFKDAHNEAQKEILPNSTKKFTDSELLPEEFLEIIKAESFKMVGDYAVEVTKRGKNVLMQGMKDGFAEAQILKMMREEMLDTSERWLKTVIRTKTTEVYNAARKTYYETDEIASQIVEAYEFSAIMDDRTSDVCSELDGKIFEKGDFVDRITPPLHFNCRSLLVPVTKFQDYSPDKEVSIDKLQKLGGNLILSEHSHVHKFKLERQKPRSGNIGNFGDFVIIEGQPGSEIVLDTAVVSNSDMQFPVTVSLLDSVTGEEKFKVTLNRMGGNFISKLSWRLSPGADLIMRTKGISSNAPNVDFTFEFKRSVVEDNDAAKS